MLSKPRLLLDVLHHKDFEFGQEIDIIVVLQLSELLVGVTRVLIHVTKPIVEWNLEFFISQ